MGATLTGTRISDTYDSLLKATDNGIITSSAKQITDGVGTNTPLYISTSRIGIGVSPTTTFQVAGNSKIGGDLTVTGNLLVEGTTTTVDTDTLSVKDPLIIVGNDNNTSDLVDLGFYGLYDTSGSQDLYAGLYRSASDTKFHLFKDLQEEPTTTVNTGGTGYAVATLVSNLEGNVTGGTISGTTGTFTGNINAAKGIFEAANNQISIVDSDDNQDFRVQVNGGAFSVKDHTNSQTIFKIFANSGTDALVINSSGATFAGNVDIDGTLDVDDVISVEGSGFGRIEVGGASGGYIDLKAPNSDDYDFRLITSTGGAELYSIDTLKFYTGSGTDLAITIDTSQDVTFEGNIILSGTVDGRDVSTDGNKLDGIEAGADVTDTANVRSAGALMDDELTNISAVKAINQQLTTTSNVQFTSVTSDLTGDVTGNADTATKIASITNSNIVQLTDTQTLTNKTIDADNNTISDLEVDNLKAGVLDTDLTSVSASDDTLASAKAIKTYVDTQVGGQDTLAEILANGNTTGGTSIDVSANDDINLSDSSEIHLGDGADLVIKHNGTNGFINNNTGTLSIYQLQDDGDIKFFCDDGTGATENYLQIDGGEQRIKVFNEMRFNDDVELRLGTGNDLKIYHDGSNSYIRELGTGNLYIDTSGTQVVITTNATAKTAATFTNNAGVDLYYDNSKKFETTSEGIAVTGNGTFDGDITTNGDITIDNSAGDPFLKLKTTAQEYVIRIDQSDSEKFQIRDVTNSATRMTIDSSGNVKVGRSSGYGSSRIQSFINNTANFASSSFLAADSTNMAAGVGGEIVFIGKYATGVDDYAFYGGIKGFKENATDNNTACALGFYTRPTGTLPTERMRIDSSGNVGIGVTSPNAKLSLAGGSNINSQNSILYIDTNSYYASGADRYITSSTAARYFQLNGEHIWSNAVSGTAGNAISFTERMRIDSNGRVVLSNSEGIQLSAKNSTLYATNGALSYYATNNAVYLNGAGPSGWLRLQGAGSENNRNAINIFGSASDKITFHTALSERMRIDSSGNLALGTTITTVGGSGTQTSTASPTRMLFDNDYSNGYTDASLKLYLFNSGTTRHGFTSGPNYDLQYHASGHSTNAQHSFYTNNNFVMRVGTGDTTNVGIGVTSPSVPLEVDGEIKSSTLGLGIVTDSSSNIKLHTHNSAALSQVYHQFTTGSTGSTSNDGVLMGLVNGFDLWIRQQENRDIAFHTNDTKRMTIYRDGNIGINVSVPQSKLHIGETATIGTDFTTAVNNSQLFVHNVGANTNSNVIFAGGDTGASGGTGAYSFGQNGQGYSHWVFYHKPISTNQSSVGSISSTSTATAYNTSSDYRLKENVVEMTGALDRVSQLKPSRFNFIADADKTVDGFLAHEVQDIVPEAITGEKDAVDEEGNAIYQGIDQAKLVPLLVGAIQELKAEIEQLKTQINN
jgi:hypothetical protein